jgi:hypothetical protein
MLVMSAIMLFSLNKSVPIFSEKGVINNVLIQKLNIVHLICVKYVVL